MWRPSGLQQASTNPADPSSILQVHSGCSRDHTWTEATTYLNNKKNNICAVTCIRRYLDAYLYQTSLEHRTHDKLRVWRPLKYQNNSNKNSVDEYNKQKKLPSFVLSHFYLLNGIKTGVELQYLKGLNISDYKSILHSIRLFKKTFKELKIAVELVSISILTNVFLLLG